ncbi:MAG: restriction endonuclease subunit S, partial [Victivallales bacterium]|nr:restriction endonuclease subunit S [Victivallales bacterium]
MTPQKLKNSILQLAIQGKLVEQRPEEGTAAELFKRIQAEKQSLIKAGKLKKEKPLPPITDDEKPFDIPDSWMWVRLEDLVIKEIKRGKSPVYISKSNTLVFAQKCNTKAGYIDLSLALFLDESKLSKYPESEFMQDMDIVINSTGNGTLGRVGIYRDNDNPNNLPIVPDSHVTVIRSSITICTEYVFHTLKYYQPYMEKLGSGSTNQTELSANIIKSLVFPLPPLAEQKRIVAKIEELLPLVDRYGAAWSRLEDFNKRFP